MCGTQPSMEQEVKEAEEEEGMCGPAGSSMLMEVSILPRERREEGQG